AVGALSVVVSEMMVQMIVMVNRLRDADSERLQHAKDPVQPNADEEGIMNEVVGDALHVPAVADDDDTERDYQRPCWQHMEAEKGPNQQGQVCHGAKGRK